MEGPSLHLAAEQLAPFIRKRIRAVSGNSRIGIERLHAQTVKDIFAWGKHLVFQFPDFALRVHFMLFGTFAATVKGASVTGDYRRSGPPQLVLQFPNGEVTIWAASVKFVERTDARAAYDFTADIMADEWNAPRALRKLRLLRETEIADALLDQDIFAGVGNIIKNEVLFRTRTNPLQRVRDIPAKKLAAIVADARTFSLQFLAWRREFVLRKNLEIYGKGVCPSCGGKVSRLVHGERGRRSFFCVHCQGAAPGTKKPASKAGGPSKSLMHRAAGPGGAGSNRHRRGRAQGA
jgi:endonuclease VIII